MSLLIHGLEQVAQICTREQLFKTGQDMNDVSLLEACDGIGLSVGVDGNGRILAIGRDDEVMSEFKDYSWDRKIDGRGKSVIPGLVDAHTHPVWAGDRVHEFSMKLAGASYMEVHKAGGGIHFTVEKTRQASEETLLSSFQDRLKKMSLSGTTFVECKSGYGLDLATELKMLKVIDDGRSMTDFLGISSTYCGAHAIPKGETPHNTTNDIINNQIPAIKTLNEKGKMLVENVDVFCEKGVFGVSESRTILQTARQNGFNLNFHTEELNYLGGAEMGASLKAEAMSHLEEISEEGIAAMASSGTVAVLLPTTAFLLRLRQPPARKLIEAGVPVALGTDFNPNAHCLSMPMVMFLACVQMRMSLTEALVASTLNAAYSLRRSHELGSLEVGKWADMLILNSPRWEHLVYQFGSDRDVIADVVYHGKIVHH